MGIPTSKVNFKQIPDWFPKDQFSHFIKQTREKKISVTDEYDILQSLKCRINSMPFIDNCKILRKRNFFFSPFTSIHTQINEKDGFLPLKLSPTFKKFGFQISFGHTRNEHDLDIQIRSYFSRDFDIIAKYKKPLIKYPNFSNKNIFPFVTLKTSHLRSSLPNGIHLITNIFQFSCLSSDSNKKGAIGIKTVTPQENRKSYFYIKPYLNTIIKYNSHINKYIYFAQKAFFQFGLIQQRANTIPMTVSKSQIKIRLFDMTNFNFDVGLILSPQKVPRNEQFTVIKSCHKAPITLPNWLCKSDNLTNCMSFWKISLEQEVELKKVSFAKLHGFVGLSNKDSNITIGIGGFSQIYGKTVEANVLFPLSKSKFSLQFQLAVDHLSGNE